MPKVQYSPLKPVPKEKPVENENPKEKEPNPEQVPNPPIVTDKPVANEVPKDQVPNPQVPNPDQSLSVSGSSFAGYDWQAEMDPAVKKKLIGLFRQRSQVEQKVVRIQFTLRDQRHPTLAQLNVISTKLAAAYSEFSKFHSEIMALIPDEAEDEQEEIYTTFESRHDATSTAVQEMILALNRKTAPVVSPPQVIIQQQPLKAPIPTFDGNYTNWPKFKAIFQDLMENSADSDAIKLYHLDKALVGAAAGSLDAKIINEGNYRQAWKVLSERYENQRVIVEIHLRGLLNLKKMSSESFKELRSLLDEATGHVESLRYLKQELTGVSEHLVVYLITAALDKVTRKAWESTLKTGELPKYTPTIEFLKTRCQILENFEMSQISDPPAVKAKTTPVPFRQPLQKSNVASSLSQTESSCDVCSGQHLNYQCSALKQLTPTQRAEKVRSSGLCFNCLRKGHQSKHCPSAKSCRTCNKRHHTLLHEDSKPANNEDTRSNVSLPSQPEVAVTSVPVSSPSTANQPVSTTCSCSNVQGSKTVLLLTAVVHAFDKDGQPHPCRVLLDSGSQVNFVAEQMANLLGMPKTRANVPITGINALRSYARDKIFVKFRSRVSEFQACIECLVTPQVTGSIPSSKIDVSAWELPEGLQFADPTFYMPDRIDLLIGGGLFFDILKPARMTLCENLPTLHDTYLGWGVTGTFRAAVDPNPTACNSNVASIEVDELNHQVCEHDEVLAVSNRSVEDSTRSSASTGRLGVQFPIKQNVDELDDCHASSYQESCNHEAVYPPNQASSSPHVVFDVGFQANERYSNSDDFLQRSPPADREKQDDRFSKASNLNQPQGQTRSATKQLRQPVCSEMWKIKPDWNEPLDAETQQKRMEFQRAPPQLNLVQLPRCVVFPKAVIHDLSQDASNPAHEAPFHVRSVFIDGSAKLRLPYKKSKTIVSSRIAEAQPNTSEGQWNYLRKSYESNFPNLVARGQLPEVLNRNNFRWDDPSFLARSEYETETINDVPDGLPEKKLAAAVVAKSTDPFQRIVRYALRIAANCKKKSPENRSLTADLTVGRSSKAITQEILHVHPADKGRRVISSQTCKPIANLRTILELSSKYQILIPDTKKLIHCHAGVIISPPVANAESLETATPQPGGVCSVVDGSRRDSPTKNRYRITSSRTRTDIATLDSPAAESSATLTTKNKHLHDVLLSDAPLRLFCSGVLTHRH